MISYLVKTFFTKSLYFVKYLINFAVPNGIKLVRFRYDWQSMPSINQKLVIQGKGVIVLGKDCVFGYKLGGRYLLGYCELQPRYNDSKIIFGSRVSVNNNLFVCAANNIEIGDETLIGQNVTIFDHDGHGIHFSNRRSIGDIGIVRVGKNVWIGNNVIILKNSIIGDNTIIAAGAVVAGTFPPNVIIGGVPARVIKEIE